MSGAALRRLVHTSSALLLLIVPLAGWTGLAVIVSAGVAVGWAVEAARLRILPLHEALSRYLPAFRMSERRRPSGAAWLGAGYALAVWFPPPAAAAAILVAAFADPAASLVGRRFSERDAGDKTVAGSASYFVVAAGALIVLTYPWWVVLAVALIATAAERWCAPLDDNLVVPPAVAAAVTFLV